MREWSLRKPKLLLFHWRGVPFSSNELRELTAQPPTDFVQAWFAETSSDPRAGPVQRRGSDQTGGQVPQGFNERRRKMNGGPIDRGSDRIAVSACVSARDQVTYLPVRTLLRAGRVPAQLVDGLGSACTVVSEEVQGMVLVLSWV